MLSFTSSVLRSSYMASRSKPCKDRCIEGKQQQRSSSVRSGCLESVELHLKGAQVIVHGLQVKALQIDVCKASSSSRVVNEC